MRSILKYPLNINPRYSAEIGTAAGLSIDDTITASLPEGAIFRHIGAQPNAPVDILFIWAEVDLDNRHAKAPPADTEIRFKVFATGQPIPADLPIDTYLGTVQHHGFVWHIYGPIR